MTELLKLVASIAIIIVIWIGCFISAAAGVHAGIELYFKKKNGGEDVPEIDE